jgi:hypothetical protein
MSPGYPKQSKSDFLKYLTSKENCMSKMESVFNKSFERFQICLPPDDVAHKRRGKIVKGGWVIWYLFGADSRGEYLDYYATHRMTTDSHLRIYDNGITEHLPALHSGYVLPAGYTKEQEQLIKEEYFAQNRQIAEMLKEKGFGLEGDEPGGVAINRYLALNDVEK